MLEALGIDVGTAFHLTHKASKWGGKSMYPPLQHRPSPYKPPPSILSEAHLAQIRRAISFAPTYTPASNKANKPKQSIEDNNSIGPGIQLYNEEEDYQLSDLDNIELRSPRPRDYGGQSESQIETQDILD